MAFPATECSDRIAGGVTRPTIRVLLVVAGCAVAVAVIFAVNRLATDVPFNHLLRDANHVSDANPAVGSLSLLGVIGWASAATLLFAAAYIGRSGGASRRRTAYLGATGLLAIGAVVDDGLQLHEVVLVEATGAPEELWFALYGLVVVGWLWVFRTELRRAPLDLAAAAGLMAAAQVLDVLPGRQVLWEESLELVAIGAFVVFAAVELGRTIRATAAGAPSATGRGSDAADPSAVGHAPVGGDGGAVDHA